MDEIHNRNASTLSFEELYRNAYNLVLHKHGPLLYDGVQSRLTFHLRNSSRDLILLGREFSSSLLLSSEEEEGEGEGGGKQQQQQTQSRRMMMPIMNASSSSSSVDQQQQYKLLLSLCNVWKEHRVTMVMVRDIFMYMDRTYVPQHRKRPVYDLGLWLFRKVVWERSMNDYSNDETETNNHINDESKKSNNNNNNNNNNHQTLGSVTSKLLLRVIHADRLNVLEDGPQRTALLKDLIHMLLELAHSNSGQFNDSSLSLSNNDGRGRGRGGHDNNNGGGGNNGDNIPVYERDFEECFLGESQEFYRMESNSRLSHAASTSPSVASGGGGGDDDDGDGEPTVASNSNNNNNDDNHHHHIHQKPAAKYSAIEYIHRAQSRITEEKNRATMLDLPVQTKTALLRIVETELIERHAKTLVDMEGSGFASILKVVTSSPTRVGSVVAMASSSSGGGGGRIGSGGNSGMGGLGDNNNNNNTIAAASAGPTEEKNGVVIDRKRIADLASMYDLFSRVPSSVNHLRDALSDRIRLDGRALVRDQETNVSPPSAFVKGVLDMRERFGVVVADAMRDEKRAQKRMREAFEDFLNADARAANCLAVYVDELLRVGLRGSDERTVMHELDRVIVIFRYLADKDVFEAYYKNHLAKRLLGNKSGSEEAERAMVSLLKAECGYQFTSKLEGMFNDMRISKETAEKYRSHKKGLVNTSTDERDAENGGKAVDVEVSVLSNSHWPSQNVQPCVLPSTVQAAMDRFQKYYLTTYTGRKLSWQTSTGSAEMRLTLPPAKGSSKPRRHDLCVTTYQMCILVLFNTHDTLTLKQIKEETQIPNDELRRHLVSLCTPKHRILRKGSKGKGISGDDDTFTYNADYTSKMTRVKVPLVSMRDAKGPASAAASGTGAADGSLAAAGGARVGGLVDGSSAVPIAVEEDRRHLLEAAIVRIMKARKMLSHNDLVAEVTKQLSGRFLPPPQFVKKRVESLIEREYLERDENDRRVYRYMA